jgi:hypothetical protein
MAPAERLGRVAACTYRDAAWWRLGVSSRVGVPDSIRGSS